MTFATKPHSVLLENVFKLIDKNIDKAYSNLVQQFAKRLYSNMSSDDLENRNDSDLYGAALSLWHQFEKFEQSSPAIRVFNPDIAKHGWHSSHTIVEIIVEDMPFLVDSIRMALNRLDITSHLLLHSPINLKRDGNNMVLEFFDNSPKQVTRENQKQTIFLIEIDRQNTAAALKSLAKELRSVVDEVSLAVNDWQPMRQALSKVTQERQKNTDNELAKSSVSFLNWLSDHNFTLMGYRYYKVNAIKGDYRWSPDNDSSLGLMKNSKTDRERLISKMAASAQKAALSQSPFILTKTNTRSRVHRPAHMDYVGIKEFGPKGEVVGEHRFIGLYSASFYNSSATQIPFFARKNCACL